MPITFKSNGINIRDVNGYNAVDAFMLGDVNEWFEQHPEATSETRYVTPQMYGAAADGTKDDADAFEDALQSGNPVFVPKGNYYISRAIDNPSSIVLIGAGRNVSKIKLGNSLLENPITNSRISGIGFECDVSNSITIFPAYLENSIVDSCTFHRFYGIFSAIKVCTIIKDNFITYLQGFFCYSTVDSLIIGNYINAPKVTNPQTVCFSHEVIHTRISNNFIDFMYKVFECDSASYMRDVTITGNVFDVNFCIFYNCVNRVTFTGNVLSNMKKRDSWDVSGNNEMNTGKWCVIKRNGGNSFLTESYFCNNTTDVNNNNGVQTYLDCTDYGYPTNNLLIDENIPSDYFDFKAYKSQYADDFKDIMIRPMLKRSVNSLPTATLSGNSQTFDHDEVIYNGNLYININGSWKQLTS